MFRFSQKNTIFPSLPDSCCNFLGFKINLYVVELFDFSIQSASNLTDGLKSEDF